MLNQVFDFLYPKSCCICRRQGNYICPSCKKLFKRNLPECYKCRRISPKYNTHIQCRNQYSLNNVFVAWEYNYLCSQMLKEYKYKSVKELSGVISKMLVEAIINSQFTETIRDTLLVPVPISIIRKNERGFNQMDKITLEIKNHLGLEMSNSLLGCHYTSGHQALKSKEERIKHKRNNFFIKEEINIKKYKSITIVDDVITTGSTLEMISRVLKAHYGEQLEVNGLCLFRGKPNFKIQ